ncbi:MAG: UDP-3-O-acyl-N-acetylglucosamine deacetylase [Synergistaceae bacterium]|nr:UDP-3-O-acyl-N-acetylglucosamine deacetylase [Synergistaceae bacterium]
MTSRRRRTLAGETVFEGKGIHSGEPSAVRISPNERGRGIEFSFGKKRYGVSLAKPDGSGRNTALAFPGGERVSTAEHILSAIAGVGLDDALITPLGGEFPIMDGSPLPFARAMTSIGFEETGENYEPPALASPLFAEHGPSFLAALPSDTLSVTYVIDYPESPVGTEMKNIGVTPETYMEELAPARTFCLESEIRELLGAGFGLGGDTGNVLVIGDREPEYRVRSECAAHKAADLLGDLLLAGFVPTARYICLRGGHSLHLKLVDRIKNGILTSIQYQRSEE